MNILNFLGLPTSSQTTPEILPPQYEEGPTLTSLDHESLAALAHELLSSLSRSSHFQAAPPQGLLTISTGGLSQLMNVVPGLRTLDADAMNADDVSRLVEYVQAKQPELLQEVVDRLNEEWPESAAAVRVTDAVRPPFQLN